MLRPLLVLLPLLLIPGLLRAQTAPTPAVPRYAKFEASWTLPVQSGNPFDPADNDVQVTFAGPGDAPVSVPAFWDGDRWRVRFAPTRPGLYALSVRRNGQDVAAVGLSPARFRCVPSASFGFVRRDPKVVQRFVFDNGRTFYPLGMDAAWTNQQMPGYAPAFAKMRTAGMNWARVWMTYWDGKNLEWTSDKAQNPPIGRYDMAAARRWDTIMDAADKNGVFIQMTLQHHGPYTEKTDPNWRDNPFNKANGGFLARPDDFFIDSRARLLTRNKYRYIVARWGYSTHLMGWELFNEVQNITEARSHFEDVVNWHKEMALAVRAEDINHHLVTTSNSPADDPLAHIGLDYDQVHTYPSDIVSFFAAQRGADVPLFTAEWGPGNARRDMTESFLHDGLWSSLMAPTAGAGQFWYWDQVIPHAWWPQYASASGFLRLFSVGHYPGLAALSPRVRTTGTLGDLSLTPPGGFEKATRETVTLSPDGRTPDLSGVPSFFQGKNHRDMMPRPIVFVLDCPAPNQFRLDIGNVAKAGAHPVLTVDGKMGAEADFPAANADHDAAQTLSVDLPAGPHRVTVFNTGADWFVVHRLAVTHYAPPVAALAKGDAHHAIFWAYARDRSAATPAKATLVLTGLAPGRYTVRLWDPWQGREIAPAKAVAHEGSVEVALPDMTRDLAGMVTLAAGH